MSQTDRIGTGRAGMAVDIETLAPDSVAASTGASVPMTAVTDRSVAAPRPRTPRPRLGVVALIVARAAGALLVMRVPHRAAAPPAGRISAAEAWPKAQRADIAGKLADGTAFTPLYFVDALTALGTARSPDNRTLRLLLRNPDGSVRLLRSQLAGSDPEFNNATMSGNTLMWTESITQRPIEIWTADLRSGPARRLTADTGTAVFYGTQYDLVVTGGRVYWTAAARDGSRSTEIRSVSLAGDAVTIRNEPGIWGLTAWPWIVDGPATAETTRLRSLVDGREIRLPRLGTELITCSPTWCRELVTSADGLVRIDLMHPDGTARRQVAGSAASEAIGDVALLDRFEILFESQPDSDLTGTQGLVTYDLRTGRTVDVSAAAAIAFARGGVLWWSTGDQQTLTWHTLDLRTA